MGFLIALLAGMILEGASLVYESAYFVSYWYNLNTYNIYDDETGPLNKGDMLVKIHSDGLLKGDSYVLKSRYIENYGLVSGNSSTIDARNMSGYLRNWGTIEALNNTAIDARGMLGSIHNYNGGLIRATNETILMNDMVGDLHNHGTIRADYDTLITEDFKGIIYNYGLIEASDADASVILHNSSTMALTLSGNGRWIGNIDNNTTSIQSGSQLQIANNRDSGTLDLSESKLRYWDTIHVFNGDVTIGDASNSNLIIQSTKDSHVHLGLGNNYELREGLLSTFSKGDTFANLSLTKLSVSNDGILELGFGQSDNDLIQVSTNGIIEDSVKLRLRAKEVLDPGTYTYRFFNNIQGSLGANQFKIELPLLYEFDSVSADQEYYTIKRLDKKLSDFSSAYNESFAKMIEQTTSSKADDLKVELERSLSVEELNEIYDRHNMLIYTSLPHINKSMINNRIKRSFGNIRYSSDLINIAQSSDSSQSTSNDVSEWDLNGNRVWVDVYGTMGETKGLDDYEMEYYTVEYGIGFHHQVTSHFITGLGITYSDGKTESTNSYQTEVKSEGYGVNGIMQYSLDALSNKLIAGYTHYQNFSSRGNSLSDDEDENTDFDSNELYLAYQLSYKIETSFADIIPLTGIRYSYIFYDDINDDDGAGVYEQSYESLESELGLRLAKNLDHCRVYLSYKWLHEWEETNLESRAKSAYGEFDQSGINIDEDSHNLGLGLSFNITTKSQLDIELFKDFSDSRDDYGAHLQLSLNF